MIRSGGAVLHFKCWHWRVVPLLFLAATGCGGHAANIPTHTDITGKEGVALARPDISIAAVIDQIQVLHPNSPNVTRVEAFCARTIDFHISGRRRIKIDNERPARGMGGESFFPHLLRVSAENVGVRMPPEMITDYKNSRGGEAQVYKHTDAKQREVNFQKNMTFFESHAKLWGEQNFKQEFKAFGHERGIRDEALTEVNTLLPLLKVQGFDNFLVLNWPAYKLESGGDGSVADALEKTPFLAGVPKCLGDCASVVESFEVSMAMPSGIFAISVYPRNGAPIMRTTQWGF